MSRDTFDSDEPELEQIRDLVEQARALALAGDRAGLTSLATVIWRRVHEPLLALTQDMDDAVDDVETVYDIAFPPLEGSMPADPEARFQRIADVLDAPWPTPRRHDLLESMLADAGVSLDTLGTVVASWEKRAVAPNTEAVARVLVDEGLPWFDTVNSREVIVREWVRHPSWHGPPYNLWEKAGVAARWGMRQEASELLRYGHHRQEQHRPKFVAVAEKYGLYAHDFAADA